MPPEFELSRFIVGAKATEIPLQLNPYSVSALGIKLSFNLIGHQVVLAHRQVSVISANPSPPSGNRKSRWNLTYLVTEAMISISMRCKPASHRGGKWGLVRIFCMASSLCEYAQGIVMRSVHTEITLFAQPTTIKKGWRRECRKKAF